MEEAQLTAEVASKTPAELLLEKMKVELKNTIAAFRDMHQNPHAWEKKSLEAIDALIEKSVRNITLNTVTSFIRALEAVIPPAEEKKTTTVKTGIFSSITTDESTPIPLHSVLLLLTGSFHAMLQSSNPSLAMKAHKEKAESEKKQAVEEAKQLAELGAQDKIKAALKAQQEAEAAKESVEGTLAEKTAEAAQLQEAKDAAEQAKLEAIEHTAKAEREAAEAERLKIEAEGEARSAKVLMREKERVIQEAQKRAEVLEDAKKQAEEKAEKAEAERADAIEKAQEAQQKLQEAQSQVVAFQQQSQHLVAANQYNILELFRQSPVTEGSIVAFVEKVLVAMAANNPEQLPLMGQVASTFQTKIVDMAATFLARQKPQSSPPQSPRASRFFPESPSRTNSPTRQKPMGGRPQKSAIETADDFIEALRTFIVDTGGSQKTTTGFKSTLIAFRKLNEEEITHDGHLSLFQMAQALSDAKLNLIFRVLGNQDVQDKHKEAFLTHMLSKANCNRPITEIFGELSAQFSQDPNLVKIVEVVKTNPVFSDNLIDSRYRTEATFAEYLESEENPNMLGVLPFLRLNIPSLISNNPIMDILRQRQGQECH